MVTQGLNPILANVEAFASTMASKFFKLMVIFHNKDWEYTFPMDYSVTTLSRTDLAGEMKFRAILKNRIKLEARQVRQETVQWFLPLVQSDPSVTGLYGKEAMAKDVIPKLAEEGYTRQQINTWFEKSDDQKKKEEAQHQLVVQQTEALKKQNTTIDPSFVNPYGSEQQFGAADISRAVSPANYDMSPEDPVPYTGGRKPSPTARRLQYGITNTAEGAAPNDMVPNTDLVASANQAAPEFLDPATAAVIDELAQTPEEAGIAANDPLTGENSMIY
jgi:hypothetical protein